MSTPASSTSGRDILLVATDREVLRVDAHAGTVAPVRGLGDARPTSLAVDALGRIWCGTAGDGVFRASGTDERWRPAGLGGEHVMSMAVGPEPTHRVWAGTEPSALWGHEGAGADPASRWRRAADPTELPSSSEWAFPPRPDTHHVRWIACHPTDPDRLWLAIEAGALIRTEDGGRSWRDRVPGGPRDTHELAVDPARPNTLHSAAGDGYFRSDDRGVSWVRPERGLDVGYLRSIAIDPGDRGIVLMSGASGPRTAYVAGRSDGRLYRREGDGDWRRVRAGWPDAPSTIAPLLEAGRGTGEIWAADERGVHRSEDGGRSWSPVASFDPTPSHLRALAVVPAGG